MRSASSSLAREAGGRRRCGEEDGTFQTEGVRVSDEGRSTRKLIKTPQVTGAEKASDGCSHCSAIPKRDIRKRRPVRDSPIKGARSMLAVVDAPFNGIRGESSS